METFGRKLQALRKSQSLTIEAVASAASISPATLRKYEAGRPVKPETVESLARVLFVNESDPSAEKEFKRLSATEWSRHQESRSPLESAIDDPRATLRICPVEYPPFSSSTESELFMEELLQHLLGLAGIRMEIVDDSGEDESDVFNVKHRLDLLSAGKTDLIIQLASARRMRHAEFLHTPVTISIAGVVRREHSDDLQIARAQLAFEWVPPAREFNVIAIEGEIGDDYWKDSRNPLNQKTMTLVRTLNPGKIADALADHVGRPMVICDEFTAMSVVEAMGGDAALVMQVSTDRGVQGSMKRKVLPSYALAIGMRRHTDYAQFRYVSQVLSMGLFYDAEYIAGLYVRLYRVLYQSALRCLQNDANVYIGDLRRVPRSQFTEKARAGADLGKGREDVLVSRALRTVAHLERQQARLYARRTLQLSRWWPQNHSLETQPWALVLSRARRQIVVSDAEDRRQLRTSVLLSIKILLGKDPSDITDTLTEDEVGSVIFGDWKRLAAVLSGELDFDLSTIEFPELNDYASPGLEPLVTSLQRVLQEGDEVDSVTAIIRVFPRPIHSDNQTRDYIGELLMAMRTGIERERQLTGGSRKLEKLTKSQEDLNPAKNRVYVAVNLGETVGCIEAEITDYPPDIRNKSKSKESTTLRVTNLVVAPYLRDLGIHRHLLRHLIEEAAGAIPEKKTVSTANDQDESAGEYVVQAQNNCAVIWLSTSDFSRDSGVLDSFARCGFVSEGEGKLTYRLDLM
ncbi:helix-turn-helix domain-containing protein [Terriglobus roseus]|uniref:Helix-turn-helix domain-containing protein n=1 Tax=Terriglobus roseus TaxID=392734 RepID=A0A1G7KTA6_9BACT|nr:helix-turn-helix transcriptional regulator [Terriglobus roseus]SDF40457.1 Helix-turn-helix domain-containing protein [Terriglobus roseus]